jgi:hypothetical protein
VAVYTDPSAISLVQNKPHAQLGAYLALLAGILAVGLAGGFFAQTMLLRDQNRSLESKIAQLDSDLKTLEPVSQELEYFNTLASELEGVFSKQYQWDHILTVMDRELYRRMTVSSLMMDEDLVTLSGTVPTFVDFAKVYSLMRDPRHKDTYSRFRVISLAKKAPEKKEGAPPVPVTEVPVSFDVEFKLGPAVMSSLDYRYQLETVRRKIENLESFLKVTENNPQVPQEERDSARIRITGLRLMEKKYAVKVLTEEKTRWEQEKSAYESEVTQLNALDAKRYESRVKEIGEKLLPEVQKRLEDAAQQLEIHKTQLAEFNI